MRNLGLLNILWDGGAHSIGRRTSESFTVRGVRFTMAMQIQEATLRSFFERSEGLARGTGFLARFLVAWPESTQGFRPYYESARNRHAKNGNEGGWGRVQRAPRGHNLFAGGSLHSSPATQYVLLTFGLQLVRVKSKQLSSSGVSGLTYMIVFLKHLRHGLTSVSSINASPKFRAIRCLSITTGHYPPPC